MPPALLFWIRPPAGLPVGWEVQYLVSIMLLGLVLCFLGYASFRVYLAFGGLMAGGSMGAALVGLYIPGPAGWQYLLAALLLAIPMGALAWWLYRVAFGFFVFALTAVLFATLTSSPTPTAGWVFGGLLGLCAGALAFMFMKPLIILVTSLLGGLMAVHAGAALAAEGSVELWEAIFGPARNGWAIAALIVSALAVVAAGIVVQFKITRRLRIAMSVPEPDESDARPADRTPRREPPRLP